MVQLRATVERKVLAQLIRPANPLLPDPLVFSLHESEGAASAGSAQGFRQSRTSGLVYEYISRFRDLTGCAKPVRSLDIICSMKSNRCPNKLMLSN